MQGMRALRESEGISYQTPILEIRKCTENPKRPQKLAPIFPNLTFQSKFERKLFFWTQKFLDPKNFSSKIFGWSLTGTVNLYKICTCISYKVSMSIYITQRMDVFCIKFLVFKSPYLQGVSKKTPEFSFITIIVITCKPCNGFTNCFFLLKTEIHAQILHTEPFLCNIRKQGYLKNKMRFRSRQI